MAIDTKTLAAARKYTDKSVAGGGAIKGKNCTIDSITPITGGNRVTFKWTLDDGTVQTGTMDVLDGQDGAQGPEGPAGADGDPGLGIKSVDINEENHLIITYDDDTWHDAGEIPGGGGTGEVISVNGKKGVVKLYATDIPVSDAEGAQTIALEISQLQGSLLNKVDKEAGKGLSTNDFSNIDKAKLNALLGIKSAGSGLNFNSETGELTATGASIDIDTELDPTSINPVQNRAIAIPVEALQGSVLGLRTDKADKNEVNQIKLDVTQLQGSVLSLRTDKADKSDLGTAASKNVPASGDASNSEVVLGSDSRLTDARNAADVSAWAKAANKPTYTASEVGAVATTDVGSSNGVAGLGSDGKVPAAQLPSYVDDVLEYSSQSAFPATGESGKIYVDLSTNKTYRWSGSAYVVIGGDLALGETASTAYAGNKGKANADAIAAIKDGTSIDSFADVETALSGKTNKVSGATNGNLAGLDSNGNLTDSGKKVSDFQTVSLADFTGDLNTLTTAGYKQYKARLSDLTNAPTVSYTPMECYIDVWSDTNNVYQTIRIVGLTYSPSAKYSSTFKRSSYNTGSVLSWGAWEQIDNKIDKGAIIPTPAATITDAALKTAINGASSSEDKIPSAYAMKKWSNVLTKRYIVDGSDASAPIGSTGIGTWDDSDTPDETDWIEIGDLTGIESSDDVDVSLKFDPLSGEPITLGGYIIDTTTGKMCIKFGNTIATPANARVAINIAFMRNEFSVI